MDVYAPLKTIMVTERNPTPWSSKDIKPEKQLRRRLERKWRRTRLKIDEDIFKKQKNKVTTMLCKMDQDDLSQKINDNKGNHKGLFKVINARTHRKIETAFPESETPQESADGLSDHFADKIDNIRIKLDSDQVQSNDPNYHDEVLFTGIPLSEFKSLTTEVLKN